MFEGGEIQQISQTVAASPATRKIVGGREGLSRVRNSVVRVPEEVNKHVLLPEQSRLEPQELLKQQLDELIYQFNPKLRTSQNVARDLLPFRKKLVGILSKQEFLNIDRNGMVVLIFS